MQVPTSEYSWRRLLERRDDVAPSLKDEDLEKGLGGPEGSCDKGRAPRATWELIGGVHVKP